ncbi:response regulator [Pelobacter seleniigenes]|uniref:response regulator n=1 Tax=Pelobacter seleniigenes TaxID=407188 RepID=UPI0004A6BC92|nr:response regulator [Pelobacter seleniigenes]
MAGRQSAATILVVDEEKNYRIILSSLLEKAGYRVVAVGGETACLDLLSQERFDLVLTDLELNDCGGLAFCRRIHALTGGGPCILFSSFLSPRCLAEMRETGIIEYIAKPFDNCELLQLIRRVLRAAAATGGERGRQTSPDR